MRSPRRAALTLAAVALSLLLPVLPATPAGAAGVHYVALGDSYSAGVGSGGYDASSGDCHRTPRAYPALWARAHHPDDFTFVACSGARTGDVVAGQLSALGPATTLVSISVGGNEVGFADVMTTCALHSQSTCLDAVAKARRFAVDQLPALLDRTYAQIHQHAPNARVVVAGYPHLYDIGGSCWFGIGDTSRSAVNEASDTVDEVIAKRAADAGFTFADVRPAFTGHGVCSNGQAWLHSATWPVWESYHPTATGQAQGYLPAFTAAA